MTTTHTYANIGHAHGKKHPRRCAALALLFILVTSSLAVAAPAPGDIFREYLWRGPWINAGNWQRVTDPDARHSGAAVFLPNPVNKIQIDDLEGAIRAEIYIELWGGHAGTSDKRLRLNGGDWIAIAEPENIPGKSGTHPLAECYQYFTYPSISLPLDQLIEGENTFEFSADEQVCFSFGWGQWGTYGTAFRIYYDESKEHVRGRITDPTPGSSFTDSLHIALESDDASVERVDFIGLYEDFDYEGNGLYRQWHYHYRQGKITQHIGSVGSPPYALTWDTSWIPEQEQPVEIAARILSADGIYYMTEAVGNLTLAQRQHSVVLYKPYDVPARWQTRLGTPRHSNQLTISHRLDNAVKAQMIMATWSGAHAEQIGVNGTSVVTNVGRLHDYSYDEIDVPLELLKTGGNEFFTASRTEEHGIEVLWPGIALKVQYAGKIEPIYASGDGSIYADALGNNWREGLFSRVEADLQSTAQTHQGDFAIRLANIRSPWKIALERDPALAIDDYTAIYLALRPQNISTNIATQLNLEINDDQRLSLLAKDRSGGGVDMTLDEWQVVEIPLREFDLRLPYIEALYLSGDFVGTLFVDDIRLVSPPSTQVPPLPQTPRLAAPQLLPSYPNPFNGSTTLHFSLPAQQSIDLGVYSLLGQRLATPASGLLAAGIHRIGWDGRDKNGRPLASGVYLYRLRAGGHTAVRRLLILR